MKQKVAFFIKRLFDIIVSAVGLVLLSPLLVLLAVLVRINLGSPIFFRQERPGLHEKIFRLYKFYFYTQRYIIYQYNKKCYIRTELYFSILYN